jgi:hypothetical protein
MSKAGGKQTTVSGTQFEKLTSNTKHLVDRGFEKHSEYDVLFKKEDGVTVYYSSQTSFK